MNSTFRLFFDAGKKCQSEYWNWLEKNFKPVSIVNSKRLNLSESLKKQVTPKIHQCYQTAMCATLSNPEIQYVEGWIEVHGVPIEHAWNRWHGIDFDLLEEHLGKEKYPHYSYFVLNVNEVRDMMLQTETTGPWASTWFRNQKNGKSKNLGRRRGKKQ